MNTITNPREKIASIGQWICKKIMKEKTLLLHFIFVWLQNIRLHNKNALGLSNFIMSEKLQKPLFKKLTSEGAVSPNVVYYQQLYIARYYVRFYAKYSFEVVTNSVQCL